MALVLNPATCSIWSCFACFFAALAVALALASAFTSAEVQHGIDLSGKPGHLELFEE